MKFYTVNEERIHGGVTISVEREIQSSLERVTIELSTNTRHSDRIKGLYHSKSRKKEKRKYKYNTSCIVGGNTGASYYVYLLIMYKILDDT